MTNETKNFDHTDRVQAFDTLEVETKPSPTLRGLYMSGRLSHADYYGFLAELIRPPIPVSIDRIRKSTDPHLNDITLRLWDNLDPIIRGIAIRVGAANFESTVGVASWSLCASVCVAKAWAKRLVETEAT